MNSIERGSGDRVTYELRGEPGPEIVWLNVGDYVTVSPRTIAGSTIEPGLPSARDPDDGTAGVPAKV